MPWGRGVDLHETGLLHDRTSVRIGPFTITPYLADHSGYDACSLLVDAAGQRLFYSGDLLGHGRKPHAYTSLITDPPRHVDTLLLEGTHLTDARAELIPLGAVLSSETAVENALVETLASTHGLVVVLGSVGQHLDYLPVDMRWQFHHDPLDPAARFRLTSLDEQSPPDDSWTKTTPASASTRR